MRRDLRSAADSPQALIPRNYQSPDSLIFPKASTHAKGVSIRMAQMKLTHIPRFISGRHRHRQPVLHRELIGFVNRGGRPHPPTHPDATGFIVADERGFW